MRKPHGSEGGGRPQADIRRGRTMATTIDSGLFRNPNRDLVVNIKGTKKPVSDDYAYPKQDWFWTGKRPVFGECPGVAEDGHMTSLPLPDVSEVSACIFPLVLSTCCDVHCLHKVECFARTKHSLNECTATVQKGTRQQLLDYFDNTWTLTEVLFSGLQVSVQTPALSWFPFSPHKRLDKGAGVARAAASSIDAFLAVTMFPRVLRV